MWRRPWKKWVILARGNMSNFMRRERREYVNRITYSFTDRVSQYLSKGVWMFFLNVYTSVFPILVNVISQDTGNFITSNINIHWNSSMNRLYRWSKVFDHNSRICMVVIVPCEKAFHHSSLKINSKRKYKYTDNFNVTKKVHSIPFIKFLQSLQYIIYEPDQMWSATWLVGRGRKPQAVILLFIYSCEHEFVCIGSTSSCSCHQPFVVLGSFPSPGLWYTNREMTRRQDHSFVFL